MFPLAAALSCAEVSNSRCENGLDLNGDGVCDHAVADWSADASIPPGTDRHNIFELSDDDLVTASNDGLQLAGAWPVNISGVMLPWESFSTLFEVNTDDVDRQVFQSVARTALGFGDLDEMATWLGLPSYPDDGTVPMPDGAMPGDPMGIAPIETDWGPAFTVSCHACHSTELFGHVVVGLTNRRTRANEYFFLASKFFPLLEPSLYRDLTAAGDEEIALFERAQANLPAVGGRVPMVHGLDTSLAQVGLSLARREADAWATRNGQLEATPRTSVFDDFVGDSKPAAWWTLRHKTRWLSDGSIVSGNPIFTNFLWNEIGRGTDLHELNSWLDTNGIAVDNLTIAVFNTPAPVWSDILPEFPIEIDAAKRGEVIFQANCAECHGQYVKGWSEGQEGASASRTTSVTYSEQTMVLDVETDMQRADGIEDFAQALNDLSISQSAHTVVQVQSGYVPPPLTGIWARFPYLHNASVPSLCALLSAPGDRPAQFWVGPPDNPHTDFDSACVGLPTTPPDSWIADAANEFDTTVPGLGNQGHDVPVDELERGDLIEFLKTL